VQTFFEQRVVKTFHDWYMRLFAMLPAASIQELVVLRFEMEQAIQRIDEEIGKRE
jgi:hypothetical protein